MASIKNLVVAGDTVVDIGANVGVYTNEFASVVGPSGKVYSFEPVAGNYDILVKLVRRAGHNNVSTSRVAVGAKAGVCEMVIPEEQGFSGYYLAHTAQPGDRGRREIVEVVALDELSSAGEIGSINFIKCDVEGAELGVIKGALQVIQSQLPGWLLEVSKDTSSEVFSIFHSYGYDGFVFNGNLVRTETYRDKEFSNYFFFHPDSAMWERASALMSAPAGTITPIAERI